MNFNIYFNHVYGNSEFTSDDIKIFQKLQNLLQSYFPKSNLLEFANNGAININKDDPYVVVIQIYAKTEQAQQLLGLIYPHDFKEIGRRYADDKVQKFLEKNNLDIQCIELYD